MSKSVLANKIGYSLFEVAKENNSLEQVSYELNEVAKVVNGSSDFVTLMNNPNIEKIKKINFYNFNCVTFNILYTSGYWWKHKDKCSCCHRF